MAHTERYERGEILTMLNSNAGRATGMGLLRVSLDQVGVSLSINELKTRLCYLEEKGYVELRRRKDIPGYHRKLDEPGGGRANDLVTAKLTAKGIDLVEGNIPNDPGIGFELN